MEKNLLKFEADVSKFEKIIVTEVIKEVIHRQINGCCPVCSEKLQPENGRLPTHICYDCYLDIIEI